MAQENGNRDAQNKVVRGPYETNRFFDNIFIGVAGGVNIYNGENDSYGSFGKRLAPALDVNVGKWITPAVGVRIGYSGVQAKGWTPDGMYARGSADNNGMFKEKFSISYLHADFLWNFSNAVGGYKETRTWNFIPFAGTGWVRSFGNDHYKNEIGVSAGLLNNIRLGNAVDLTLEARYLIVNQRLDGVVRGSKAEGMFSATIGFTYKFNRRGFKRVEHVAPADYTPYLSRISQLESSNGDLASKNSVLNAENEKLRNAPVAVVTEQEVSIAPVALFFSIGKATLDSKELTNLDFYVKNAMKADANKVFTLTGSADKATGNHAINQRLSEQRMEYVYKLLTEKYGISPKQLVKRAEGDMNNRFSEAALNRVVIVE